MPLPNDNQNHRNWSNKLDKKFVGKDWYGEAAEHIHGTYGPAFEYLKIHREEQKKEEAEAAQQKQQQEEKKS